MIPVTILLIAVTIYLACGLLFAVPFVIKGINRIDDGAHGSSIGFRIIILPGVIVFWPLLLKRWIKAKQHRHDEAA